MSRIRKALKKIYEVLKSTNEALMVLIFYGRITVYTP